MIKQQIKEFLKYSRELKGPLLLKTDLDYTRINRTAFQKVVIHMEWLVLPCTDLILQYANCFVNLLLTLIRWSDL